ncbi:MAG TPA: ABC transporter permease [Candidatus Limnocylindria bacterium]
MSVKEADRLMPVTAGETAPRERRSVVRPSPMKRYEPLAVGTASVVGVLAVWQFILRSPIDIGPLPVVETVHLEFPPLLFLPRPSDIAQAFVKLFQQGEIWLDIATSGQEILWGYGLAVILGLILGLLMGWYTRFQYALDPFVNFFYSTPRIVLIPLFIIWFGIDMPSKIAVIFLGALFPIIINTMAGVRNTEAALLRVAKSFGASDALIFRRVVLPGSVPFILTGFRLGVGHALTGVVVGELIAARHGVGQLIAISGQTFQTPKLFAGVIIIAGTGMLLTTILQRVENRFQSWRPQIRR